MPVEMIKAKYYNDVEKYALISCAEGTVNTLFHAGYSLKEMWDIIVSRGVDNLTEVFDDIYKLLIRFLSKKFEMSEISSILFISAQKLEQLAEQIEDDELLALVNTRVASYGGWEKALESAIPAEQVYAEFGITQEMIDNAPDVDFEVTAI